MSCLHAYEHVEIVAGHDDRIRACRLTSCSCGCGSHDKALEASPLLGLTIDAVLALKPADLPTESDAACGRFQTLKLLVAVQAALRVWLGLKPGDPEGLCAPARIHTDAEETTISARLRGPLLQLEIEQTAKRKQR